MANSAEREVKYALALLSTQPCCCLCDNKLSKTLAHLILGLLRALTKCPVGTATIQGGHAVVMLNILSFSCYRFTHGAACRTRQYYLQPLCDTPTRRHRSLPLLHLDLASRMRTRCRTTLHPATERRREEMRIHARVTYNRAIRCVARLSCFHFSICGWGRAAAAEESALGLAGALAPDNLHAPYARPYST
jgi:hypothetical protein